jgi:pilus assembly protein CpaE
VLAVDDSVTIREALELLIGAQPDIVLMDIHMPDLDGIQATWLVSSRAPHGAVIMVTSEERIDFLQKAMSAGAQGYVLKPFRTGAQLFQTIREVHGRSSARRMQMVGGAPIDVSLRPRIGKRIVVLGPKGGVGSTTLAVNVALLLGESTQRAVALFDADFLAGDTTIHLDVTPQRTVLDLVPHIDALDARLIDQVMVKHRSGLHVLARPTNAEQADVRAAEHVRTILSSLAQMYGDVVIDGVLTYDDRMLAVLDLADLYVVIVTPHLGTLRSARHFLQVARTLGYPDDRMCFVLNRASDVAGLSFDDIATVLGSRSLVRVPTGGPEVRQAINEGRPLVLSGIQPRGKLGTSGLSSSGRAANTGLTPTSVRDRVRGYLPKLCTGPARRALRWNYLRASMGCRVHRAGAATRCDARVRRVRGTSGSQRGHGEASHGRRAAELARCARTAAPWARTTSGSSTACSASSSPPVRLASGTLATPYTRRRARLQAAFTRSGAADGGGDLREGHREHVVQHEPDPLGRSASVSGTTSSARPTESARLAACSGSIPSSRLTIVSGRCASSLHGSRAMQHRQTPRAMQPRPSS